MRGKVQSPEPQNRALAELAAAGDRGLVATGSVRDAVIVRLEAHGLAEITYGSRRDLLDLRPLAPRLRIPIWRITEAGRAIVRGRA